MGQNLDKHKTIDGTIAAAEDITRIINGEHTDPSSVLGLHFYNALQPSADGKSAHASTAVIRTYRPGAVKIDVIESDSGRRHEMRQIQNEGLFEAVVPSNQSDGGDYTRFNYKLEITWPDSKTETIYDPYSFAPTMGEFDIHLFNEGNHHRAFDRLGAHLLNIGGVEGTAFAVWAPCAKRVSVVGEFNGWDGRVHQMRMLGSSGVWELFIPGIAQNTIYKYEIKTYCSELYIKSDPYAFYSELRPQTASIVYDLDKYSWNDEDWIKRRDSGNFLDKPVSIYEVHLGSWARVPEEGGRMLTYLELADRLVKYVKAMGFTHIELLPVSEHPFDGSWGYQTTGYYSVTSRHGKPEDFMLLVDKCHQAGIAVIIDWVPAHFPKDGHGLARFDGTALYEHQDSKQGEHPDWGTHIFNFGRNEVRNFLVSNALFWVDKYHIDGLRVDAVASMLYLDYGKKPGEWIENKWGGKENVDAIEFMRQLNTTVFKYYPGVMMIAEESTSWALVSKPPYVGGLGFSFKWNMGWMNDFLRYISLDPVYRRYHHNNLTFSLMYAFSENFILVLSHDEVVHEKSPMINKIPGDEWQKFAGLRACYGYMYGHPGKKLLFMGGEYGQTTEWNYQKSLDWDLLGYGYHRMLQRYVRDLNNLYSAEPALYEDDYSGAGFEWIDCSDADRSIISFIRKSSGGRELLVFVCNFTPVPYTNYRIGAPFKAFYKEVLNSDSGIYGGSNAGNMGGLEADDIPCHGRPASLNLTIPPYGVIVLKPVNAAEADPAIH